jgi:hypothetical protein
MQEQIFDSYLFLNEVIKKAKKEKKELTVRFERREKLSEE